MLFRVEGTNVKLVGTPPVYLLEAANELPGWLRALFKQVDDWVFEADFDAFDPSARFLAETQSLRVLELFDDLAQTWARLELPGAPARFRVWAAADEIQTRLSGMARHGLERAVVTEARQRGVPMRFIERVEAITERRDEYVLREQVERLAHLVRDSQTAAAQTVALFEAWNIGDLDRIGESVDTMFGNCPEISVQLAEYRAGRLMPAVREVLKVPARTALVLDASHLGGEAGILSSLTREGYTLTRLL